MIKKKLKLKIKIAHIIVKSIHHSARILKYLQQFNIINS